MFTDIDLSWVFTEVADCWRQLDTIYVTFAPGFSVSVTDFSITLIVCEALIHVVTQFFVNKSDIAVSKSDEG